MKRLMLIAFATLSTLTGATYAAKPKCQSQTLGMYTSKLCVTQQPFQHDYYTLWVDADLIFTLPDDYIENITLAHRIPEDAAIEFPLSQQGMPTVTISGGCSPISEKQELGGKMIGIEVGRSCSFNWGSVPILNDLQVRF
jgi:hypothetical protein